MDKSAWTPRHEEAVLLVAADALTDVQIAEKLEISKRTLENWKAESLFQEKLDAVITEMCAAIRKHGVARLDRRVGRLNKTWLDLQTVIEERATELGGECAGAETGLIVKREKPGMFGTTVEYQVDTGLLAELRAVEMQAAKELGQWTKKLDVTSGGEKMAAPGPDLRKLSSERLKQLEEILTEAGEAVSGDGSAPDPSGDRGGAVPPGVQ